MSGRSMDLGAYFRRIAYPGGREPTLETLKALHACHVLAIPFENLSPLLGERVALDVGSLQDKLVRRGRGGYCYEHNLLFREVLGQLGYRVTGLAARVLWNVPSGVVRPRSHMLMLVAVDGRRWIADVGFGSFTLTAPLDLDTEGEQPTSHEALRLVRSGGDYRLEVKLGRDWFALYTFDLQEQQLSDYELANWYTSTYPQSLFVTNLIACRTLPGWRITLRDHDFAVHHAAGNTDRRSLTSVDELRSTLETAFGIPLSGMPGLDSRLAAIMRRPAAPENLGSESKPGVLTLTPN